MTKDELMKKYKGKGISEIEEEIQASYKSSKDAQADMIFALAYLKYSKRWKENPVYKTSTFNDYLIGTCNMRSGTFEDSLHAYKHFPEESKRYGVGAIAKIRRKCGAVQEKQVVKEIATIQKGLKKRIDRDKIETVISKYAKPETEKKPAVDWKTKYHQEAEAHRETTRKLIEAKKQIEKLKKTVFDLRPLRDMRDALMPFMMPENEMA